MAEECLRIDIPYPVRILAKFPCLEQVAGIAEVSVGALPGLAVGLPCTVVEERS